MANKQKDMTPNFVLTRGHVTDGGKAAMGSVINYEPKAVDGVDNRKPVGGHKYSDWDITPIRVDEELRTFPGVQCLTSGAPGLMDAVSEEGTTETRGGGEINKSHSNAHRRLNRNFGKPMQYEGSLYNNG
jgi:hypothetical protein